MPEWVGVKLENADPTLVEREKFHCDDSSGQEEEDPERPFQLFDLQHRCKLRKAVVDLQNREFLQEKFHFQS